VSRAALGSDSDCCVRIVRKDRDPARSKRAELDHAKARGTQSTELSRPRSCQGAARRPRPSIAGPLRNSAKNRKAKPNRLGADRVTLLGKGLPARAGSRLPACVVGPGCTWEARTRAEMTNQRRAPSARRAALRKAHSHGSCAAERCNRNCDIRLELSEPRARTARYRIRYGNRVFEIRMEPGRVSQRELITRLVIAICPSYVVAARKFPLTIPQRHASLIVSPGSGMNARAPNKSRERSATAARS